MKLITDSDKLITKRKKSIFPVGRGRIGGEKEEQGNEKGPYGDGPFHSAECAVFAVRAIRLLKKRRNSDCSKTIRCKADEGLATETSSWTSQGARAKSNAADDVFQQSPIPRSS